MQQVNINDENIIKSIQELIQTFGGAPDSFESELVMQLIQTSLRLLTEGHDLGQLKLITRALKELRYAYHIFNQYPNIQRVSIFGSARTPEDHPDYAVAKQFSKMMAESGWFCITGGANGIMRAGLEGHEAEKESGFGLSIRLPFEDSTQSIINGDRKLIHFRYYFTRKLMFMSHAHAVAAFPGGFGTMDELFEVLTLMQTGKSHILPVVLLEGENGGYWKGWVEFVKKQFLGNGWISPDDENFFYQAPSVEQGVAHIHQFYNRYHSSRFVRDDLVIRLKTPLSQQTVEELNRKYKKLIQSGEMRQCSALPEEKEFAELPRLCFHYTRHNMGLLRALIDDINKPCK